MTTDHPRDDDQGQGSDDRAGSEPGQDRSPEPQLDPDSPGATIDDPEPAEPNEPG